MVTYEEVRNMFDYDSETGILSWQVTGAIATFGGKDGYEKLIIDGEWYNAHRVIWLWAYGEWPNTELDHINCLKADNRLTNLREISRSENCMNVISKKYRFF